MFGITLARLSHHSVYGRGWPGRWPSPHLPAWLLSLSDIGNPGSQPARSTGQHLLLSYPSIIIRLHSIQENGGELLGSFSFINFYLLY